MQVRVELENAYSPSERYELELSVDTRACYSRVPAGILRRLGVKPRETLLFQCLDGSTVERAIGEVRFYCEGRNAICKVVFGEEGDTAVLGFVTLAAMALEMDPKGEKLRSMEHIPLYAAYDAAYSSPLFP